MKNPTQWFEIATTDIERAKAFYTKVFDLELQFIEMPDSKMYMFGDPESPGSPGALIENATVKPNDNGTVVYFSCDDVAKKVSLAEEAGGKVLIPRTDIGEFGFYAHVLDTEGNRIGIHSNVQ